MRENTYGRLLLISFRRRSSYLSQPSLSSSTPCCSKRASQKSHSSGGTPAQNRKALRRNQTDSSSRQARGKIVDLVCRHRFGDADQKLVWPIGVVLRQCKS